MKLDWKFLQETQQLAKKLEQAGKSLEGSEITSVMEKATAPLVADAQRRVNVVTGNLRNSIGLIKRRKVPNVVIVGVRNYGAWNAKGYHAHMIEYGTKRNRKTLGKGQYRAGAKRGGVKPGQFAFMQPAFAANQSKIQMDVFNGIRNLIQNKLKQ
ncbi:MAG: HK97 gp10 family phage protein [Candidatus Puniceispirillaceae bacterium]